MDAVVDHVRDNWASEGAEVASFGKSSVTVAMPHEFRQIDAVLSELTSLFPVSTDLELTSTGANLYIQQLRNGRINEPAARFAPHASKQVEVFPMFGCAAVMGSVAVLLIAVIGAMLLLTPRAA
jgi:hypothetical protein